MGGDDEKSEKLESQASELIDQGATDEARLDEAAEILAEAERLKGPIDKFKSGSKNENEAKPKD